MKGGQNPTRIQKKLLEANGKTCTEWLIVKTTADAFVFKHKTTGEIITIPKN